MLKGYLTRIEERRQQRPDYREGVGALVRASDGPHGLRLLRLLLLLLEVQLLARRLALLLLPMDLRRLDAVGVLLLLRLITHWERRAVSLVRIEHWLQTGLRVGTHRLRMVEIAILKTCKTHIKYENTHRRRLSLVHEVRHVLLRLSCMGAVGVGRLLEGASLLRQGLEHLLHTRVLLYASGGE